MVLDSAMSGTAFRACVEQVLMPTLRPGDIIVMGNLPTHKAEGVRQAIEVAVASYSTTPPNSPDFKPIEKAFTKLSAPPKQEQSAQSKLCGTQSARSWRFSNSKNAPTASRRADMTPSKMGAL